MCEGEKNNDLKWYEKSWLCFAVTCAIVTITTAVSFWCWHSSNASRQDYIFKVYKTNIEQSHDLLKGARLELLDSLRSNPEILLADYDTMDRLTKIAEKLSEEHTATSLLEVEANKIQNQYEALGIWAAIITIVFLIFSFYNLFKSEELQREGRQALQVLHDLEAKAQTSSEEINKFQTKGQSKLDEFELKMDTKFKSFDRVTGYKIDELKNTLSPLKQKIADILRYVEVIKNENKRELEETYEKEKSKLQNFINNETQRQNEITKTEIKRVDSDLDSLKRQIGELNNNLDKLQDSINRKDDIESDKTASDMVESSDYTESADYKREDESDSSNNEY